MTVKIEQFGILKNHEEVSQIILTNKFGMEVRLISFGAAISHLFVKSKDNVLIDVALGYERLEDYEEGTDALGAVVGRHANRLKDAQVIIDNISYNLTANDGTNSLHSGPNNLIKKNFAYSIIDAQTVRFVGVSPNMEEGFPGKFTLGVEYTLNDENQLIIKFDAITDRSTPVNITNHTFFNLNGHDSGTSMGHHLIINSNMVTENDKTSIPTGNFIDVSGTPFDFKKMRVIGERIDVEDTQLVYGQGYDQNYVLNKNESLKCIGDSVIAAQLIGDKTGIIMNTYTTQPGLQLYSANHLTNRIRGKGNAIYNRRYGICLETQHFPAAPSNHHFPNVILRPGEVFRQTTIYEFI